MPALTVFRDHTTAPLAGDDFQIVCLVLGAYRVIQLACIVPLVIAQLVDRFSDRDVVINGYYAWCPQWQERYDKFVITEDLDEGRDDVERSLYSTAFIILASVYIFLDSACILGLWGGACMGTPTQPMGRDECLRSLIFCKFALRIFPFVLLAVGCLRIKVFRENNYSCEDQDPIYYPDEEWNYVLYCILLVTYSLEILVWPASMANKIIRFLRQRKFIQNRRYATEARGERLEQLLGGFLKCISVASCHKAGSKDLKNKGEMRDFATNLMEFANNESKVGVVFSDMYVGGKLLARVQAERRMKAIQILQHTSNKKYETPDTAEESQSSSAPSGRRGLLENKVFKKQRSILTIQTDCEGKHCVVVEKNVLTSRNEDDVEVLRNATHYSRYAEWVYFDIRKVVEDHFPATDATMFVRDFERTADMADFSLAAYDAPHVHIYYAHSVNGIAATPYAILVDEEEHSVVIAVRGTVSLTDWVVDLQYISQPLDRVGDVCGFNGKGHHCHKGVLTRCKWTYNDIKKQRVLHQLYSDDSPYREYKLVVVGHSLGGGCAQVLSLMLRPSFPLLRCYAFEPPGCIFDDKLSEVCKEWITSIVRHDDVVPRVTQPNLENLRDEFFDIVARIRVPKCKAFHDVRSPCPDYALASRNKSVLYPKGEIDRDTLFYQRVQTFRKERAAKNLAATKLYIPGNIIHLVDTTGDDKYVPYWASRYEFNQVIISSRMLSDHSIPPLVQILQGLNLDDVHEVKTWHVADKKEEGEAEDVEILVLIPFSNPQGGIPLLLVMISLIAVVMGGLSNQVCRYVNRSTTVVHNGASMLGHSLNAGLWSYQLKQCIDTEETCDELDASKLEDSDFCQLYDGLFTNVDSIWFSARMFGALSVVLGVIGICFVSLATCMKLRRRSWIALVLLFLLVTLCQGLQFLIFKSNLCKEWAIPEMDIFSKKGLAGSVYTVDCTLSTGGILGVAAMMLWFVIIVGCSHMARKAQNVDT